MRLTRVLKHLFFGGGKSLETGTEFKPTDSRMYRVAAVVEEIAPDPENTVAPGIVLYPRRVLNIEATRFLPDTRAVKLRFVEVVAGRTKASRGEGLPNLLLDHPDILKDGWYDVVIAFLTSLRAGHACNGVVLVNPSREIKTFTPSPRSTPAVSGNRTKVSGIRGGLTS